MALEKVVTMIPEVKRASLGSKPVWKRGTVTFKTKNGKTMTIPEGSVLIMDEKSITYKLLRRKLIKGDFELNGTGFLTDADLGTYINPEILAVAEEKAERTKEQKKQDKKRAAALAASRDKKAGRSAKVSRRKKK